jgi:DNA ligase-1
MVSAGAEGLMLKRRNSLYRAGRSDDLLKVKTHEDAEARVVGHLPGKGKYEGMMGALKVELEDGRRFRIGTGFTDNDRANPPAIGSMITFRYRGLTATGLPRFASFLRIRNDEPVPQVD